MEYHITRRINANSLQEALARQFDSELISVRLESEIDYGPTDKKLGYAGK